MLGTFPAIEISPLFTDFVKREFGEKAAALPRMAANVTAVNFIVQLSVWII